MLQSPCPGHSLPCLPRLGRYQLLEVFVSSLILLRGVVFKLFVQTFPSVFYCCVTTGKHRGTKLHFILNTVLRSSTRRANGIIPAPRDICGRQNIQDAVFRSSRMARMARAWPEHLTGDVCWRLRSPCGLLSWLSDMWSLQ